MTRMLFNSHVNKLSFPWQATLLFLLADLHSYPPNENVPHQTLSCQMQKRIILLVKCLFDERLFHAIIVQYIAFDFWKFLSSKCQMAIIFFVPWGISFLYPHLINKFIIAGQNKLNMVCCKDS